MSEKFKEFAEIPQEFIKDGQQVRQCLSLQHKYGNIDRVYFSSSLAAQNHRRRVSVIARLSYAQSNK